MTHHCYLCQTPCLEPGADFNSDSDGAISDTYKNNIYCIPCHSVADLADDINDHFQLKSKQDNSKSKPKSVAGIRCPKCKITFCIKNCPTAGCKMINPLMR